MDCINALSAWFLTPRHKMRYIVNCCNSMSMGSFGLSMAIRGKSKDPLGKKFQSFQIIYNIIESFQSHLLKIVCIRLFLQPIGRDNLVGTALSYKSLQFGF